MLHAFCAMSWRRSGFVFGLHNELRWPANEQVSATSFPDTFQILPSRSNGKIGGPGRGGGGGYPKQDPGTGYPRRPVPPPTALYAPVMLILLM